MSIIFISDIHLSSDKPHLTDFFKSFIEQCCETATHIYILGDLFDLWLGDDDESHFAREVKATLKKATDKGINLFFQKGNKDFTIGKKFARQTNIQILPDEYIVDHFGQRALLMHGDSLCTDDIDYQKFRRKSRHPLYLWCLLKIPLNFRKKLAAKWRKDNFEAKLLKDEEIMDVSESTVLEKMQIHDVEVLLHGHTHRPNIHKNSFGQRIVLGEWSERAWYVSLDQSGFDLKFSPI